MAVDILDKHPVYYLFIQLQYYQEQLHTLNILNMHDQGYYERLKSEMLSKRKPKAGQSAEDFSKEIDGIIAQKKAAEAEKKEKIIALLKQIEADIKNKDLFAYYSKEMQQNQRTLNKKENIKSSVHEIIDKILQNNTQDISLPSELHETAKEYGEYFKIEEYKKLFPFIQLAMLLEGDQDAAASYTFNLIVTFGDADSAMKYISAYQAEQKNQITQELIGNSLYPIVYKACQFTPLPPPSTETKAHYDKKAFEDWRALIKQKTSEGFYMLDNNFRNALGNAPAITSEFILAEEQTKAKTISAADEIKEKTEKENQIRLLKDGCDIYVIKATKEKDTDSILNQYRNDILNRKKILVIAQENGNMNLHFSSKEQAELQYVPLDRTLASLIDQNPPLNEKVTKLKRSEANELLYESFDKLITSNGGLASSEGYDSMMMRQSDFEDNEIVYIRLEEQIKALKIELAKQYYHGIPLIKAPLYYIDAFNCLSLTRFENIHDQYLSTKGIADKWRKSFFNLNRNNAGKHIPNIFIDCAEINPNYAGYYLIKVNVQDLTNAVRAATFGRETDCCQSYSGEAGTPCAKHGLTSPYGGFYIIRQGDAKNPKPDDPLIHQSWVWRDDNNSGICLDSIERTAAGDALFHVADTDNLANLIENTLDTLALRLIANPTHGITQVNTGAVSGISKDIGKTLCQHGVLVPMDYTDYRDSHRQHILSASDAPYILYTLPEASLQIDAFLKKLAMDCKDKKTLADLPQVKDFILFYILNVENPEKKPKEESKKDEHDINMLMKKLIQNNPDINLLVENSISATKTLQAILKSSSDIFLSKETFEQIKILLKDASIRISNEEGESLLTRAASLGHVEMVQYLLDQGANIEHRDSNGMSALARACYCVSNQDARFEIVKLLLAKNTLVNSQSSGKNTPLLWAVSNNSELKLIELLCEKGADIDAKSKRGETPFSLALKLKRMDLLRYLLDQNVKVENPDAAMNDLLKLNLPFDNDLQYIITQLIQKGANKIIALSVSSQLNQESIIQYILEEKDTKENASKSLFEFVSIFLKTNLELNENVKNIINHFMQKGADANIVFDAACKENSKNNVGLIKFLMEQNFTIKNPSQCLLDFSQNYINNPTDPNMNEKLFYENIGYIVNALIRKGADVNINYPNGNTILDAALEKDKIFLLKILLENGVKVENATVSLINFCKKSVSSENFKFYETVQDVIRLLLEKGADINAEYTKRVVHAVDDISYYDSNILEEAIKEGYVALIRYLIEQGARIENEKKFFLEFCNAFFDRQRNFDKNAEHILNTLIDNGIDINTSLTSREETLLDRACQSGQVSMIRYLMQKSNNTNPGAILQKYLKTFFHNDIPFNQEVKDFIHVLVSQGAKIDLSFRDALTLAYDHQNNNQKELMSFLIQEGATIPSAQADQYMIRLWKDLFFNRQLIYDENLQIIVRHLIKKGANINAAFYETEPYTDMNDEDFPTIYPSEETTAIEEAYKNKNLLLMQDLLDNGVLWNNQRPNSIFLCFCNIIFQTKQAADIDEHTKNTIHNMIVSRGADINAKYSDGSTVLNVVCGLANISMIKYLLEQGAKVENPTEFLLDFLKICDKKNLHSDENIKYIIHDLIDKKKADINKVNGEGETAFSILSQAGALVLIQFLSEDKNKVESELSEQPIPTMAFSPNAPSAPKPALDIAEQENEERPVIIHPPTTPKQGSS